MAWTFETNAEVLLRKGEVRAARELFRQALERYRQVAPDDLGVARAAARLVQCGFQLDELAGLEPIALDWYEIVRELRGEDHPRAKAVADTLALLRRRLAETEAPGPDQGGA